MKTVLAIAEIAANFANTSAPFHSTAAIAAAIFSAAPFYLLLLTVTVDEGVKANQKAVNNCPPLTKFS